MTHFIKRETVEHKLSWVELTDAILAGHKLPPANIDDILFKQGSNALLDRAAWISGLGIGVKVATVFPGNIKRNPALPNVHSVFILFDNETGEPKAFVDGNLVTKWKTAADSALGAKLLARADSKVLTVIGAGAVAGSIIDAYRALFPELETIQVWNRNSAKAEALAEEKGVNAIADLEQAVSSADMVSSSTMATSPVIVGEWVQPGTHIDLIGAYRPDMREADDGLLLKSRIFVDSRKTAIHDIGELAIPIAANVISEKDVVADFYDLNDSNEGRKTEQEITLFKNGGGAHLDLMTALYIIEKSNT